MPEMPRLWKSPKSDFGKARKIHNDLEDETVTAERVYTDAELESIAGQNFNSIWVHGLLRHIVPSEVFPEFGRNSAAHLRSMRRLIERAVKHGLGVYLYMQPPRAIDAESPFWKAHPEAGGVESDRRSDDDHPMVSCSLCTSAPEVREYLRQGMARVFRELDGLRGVIFITASEYPSHCFGKIPFRRLDGGGPARNDLPCPRCREREPLDALGELFATLRGGVRESSEEAHIIFWNWGWDRYAPKPYRPVIERIPDDCILMAGFERGGRKRILGRMRNIDEYALSYVGPSKVFRDSLGAAKERGIPLIAKLQIGTTHELATVASLPLLTSIYEKAAAMRKLGVKGFVGCWTFGNCESANTNAFCQFFGMPRLPGKRTALKQFADRYFPGANPAGAVDAWEIFYGAMRDYPFCIPFLYAGPANYALAFPLRPGPVGEEGPGRSWQMDKRGENLEKSLGCYTLAEVIGGLGKLVRAWKKGARKFEEALAGCPLEHARLETHNAWLCYHAFRSTQNLYHAFRLRKRWPDQKAEPYLAIARDEIDNLAAALPHAESSPWQGFHIECQDRMFGAKEIKSKIRTLKRQVRTLEEES